MLAFFLLLAPALATDAFRCEAVMTGPSPACELPGTWSATGTGKTEVAAGKAAIRRLENLVVSVAEERAQRTAGTLAQGVAERAADACNQSASTQARLHCYPEPALADKKICLISLADTACWRSAPLDLEGPAWKVMEQGRDLLCSTMDANLEAAGASDLERLSCQVSCLENTAAKCISLD